MPIKLSIITVNFNNKAGLLLTAKSILNQQLPEALKDTYNWIIVDGGSTDGSSEFVEQINKKLFWSCSEEDGGIYQGMNKGIEHANGEFLLFINSGDTLANDNTIKTLLNLLARSQDKDIIRCAVNCTSNNKAYAIIHPFHNMSGFELFTNDIPHQGALIRREILQREKYDTAYRITADMHFFRKAYMQLNARDGVFDVPICNYDTGGISSVNFRSKIVERDKSWISLFGQYSYNDYCRLAHGNFYCERVICKIRRKRFLISLCNILLFPVHGIITLMHIPYWFGRLKRFITSHI